MEEIADGVYIETDYAGVTLGLIQQPQGLILIDAPLRADDARAWRSSHASLCPNSDRLLINLDAHLDRTLGARAMEQTIIAHHKTAQAFHSRPTTFKSHAGGAGAEWEQVGGLGSIRWLPPEICFSDTFTVNWGKEPVLLVYHPGPSAGAIWVVLPEARVAFLGDAVLPNQPPFLSHASIPEWIEGLQLLFGADYEGYRLVSGRSKCVTLDQVKWQIDYLTAIQTRLDEMAERKAPSEETQNLVAELLTWVVPPAERKEQYTQRLKWGLFHYYARRYHSASFEEDE